MKAILAGNASDKVSKTGDTMTGTLILNNSDAALYVSEGATRLASTSIEGNEDVEGSLSVSESLVVSGSLRAKSDVIVMGTTILNDTTQIEAPLTVAANTTVQGHNIILDSDDTGITFTGKDINKTTINTNLKMSKTDLGIIDNIGINPHNYNEGTTSPLILEGDEFILMPTGSESKGFFVEDTNNTSGVGFFLDGDNTAHLRGGASGSNPFMIEGIGGLGIQFADYTGRSNDPISVTGILTDSSDDYSAVSVSYLTEALSNLGSGYCLLRRVDTDEDAENVSFSLEGLDLSDVVDLRLHLCFGTPAEPTKYIRFKIYPNGDQTCVFRYKNSFSLSSDASTCACLMDAYLQPGAYPQTLELERVREGCSVCAHYRAGIAGSSGLSDIQILADSLTWDSVTSLQIHAENASYPIPAGSRFLLTGFRYS